MSDGESLFIAPDLREYAAALDKDRGHDKSAVTRLMRAAADEIDQLSSEVERLKRHVPPHVAKPGNLFDAAGSI